MFFKLLFSTAKFEEIFKAGVSNLFPAITKEFFDRKTGRNYWIDHLSIEGSPTLLRGGPSKRPQLHKGISGEYEEVFAPTVTISVPVKINLVQPEHVADGGASGASIDASSITVSFVFGINADSWRKIDGFTIGEKKPGPKGGVQLVFRVIDVAAPEPERSDLLRYAEEIKLPELNVPLDDVYKQLGAIEASEAFPPVDLYPKIVASGVTIEKDVLAIMVQLGPERRDSATIWNNFYFSELMLIPAGQDCEAVLDYDIFVRPILDKIYKGITKDGKIHITHYPNGTLSNIGARLTETDIPDGAHLDIVFKGTVDAAHLAIEVEVTIGIDITVKNGVLQVHIRAAHDLNDWDVFVAAFTASVIGSIIGVVIGGNVAGPAGSITGAIILGIGAFAGVIIFASTYPSAIPDSAVKDMKCETPIITTFLGEFKDDSQRVCKMPIDITLPGGGRLTPQSAGVNDTGGFFVSGLIKLPALKQSFIRIVTPIEEFSWAPSGKDETGFRLITIETELIITATGTTPIRFGKFELLGRWKDYFSLSTIGNGYHSTTTIKSVLPKEYWASPEPLTIYLHTNAGVRIFDLPLPVRPSDEEIDERIEFLKGIMKKAKLIDPDRAKSPGGLPLKLAFSRNVTPVDLVQWEVGILNNDSNLRIRLDNSSNQSIEVLQESSQSPRLLQTFSAYESGNAPNLRILENGALNNDLSIHWRQTAWHYNNGFEGNIQFAALALNRNNKPLAIMADGESVILYDVEDRILASRVFIKDVTAIVSLGKSWLLGSSLGLFQCDLVNHLSDLMPLSQLPVLALSFEDNHVFVLYENKLQILDSNLQEKSTIQVETTALSINVSNKLLFVAGTLSITIYDITQIETPRIISRTDWPSNRVHKELRSYKQSGLLWFIHENGAVVYDPIGANGPKIAAELNDHGTIAFIDVLKGTLLRWDKSGVSTYKRGEFASRPEFNGVRQGTHTAARIIKSAPSDGDFLPDAPAFIEVSFDKAIKPCSISAESIKLETIVNNDWRSMNGVPEYLEKERKIIFKPDAPLINGVYRMVVSGSGEQSILDIDGLQIDGNDDLNQGGDYMINFIISSNGNQQVGEGGEW